MELENLEKGRGCKSLILMFSPFFLMILSNFHEFGSFLRI